MIKECDTVLFTYSGKALDSLNSIVKKLCAGTSFLNGIRNCDILATDLGISCNCLFGICIKLVIRNVSGDRLNAYLGANLFNLFCRMIKKSCELDSVIAHVLNLFYCTCKVLRHSVADGVKLQSNRKTHSKTS